jgi:50S ribosomal subunit-associated GTPase HflX
LEKPQIVTINKIDLPTTRTRLKKEIDILKQKGLKILTFSAITGEGIQTVVNEIAKALHMTEEHNRS